MMIDDFQLALLYDEDHDGVLTTEDLHMIFAPLPDGIPLWESCSSLLYPLFFVITSLTPAFPDNVNTTETGGITYSTFIGLWFLLLRYEPILTLYTLLQLGYWKDYRSLVRWVKQVYQQSIISRKEQHDRHFVHCCVVGDSSVGKVLI